MACLPMTMAGVAQWNVVSLFLFPLLQLGIAPKRTHSGIIKVLEYSSVFSWESLSPWQPHTLHPGKQFTIENNLIASYVYYDSYVRPLFISSTTRIICENLIIILMCMHSSWQLDSCMCTCMLAGLVALQLAQRLGSSYGRMRIGLATSAALKVI